MHLLRSFYARSYCRMPRTSRPHTTYGARYARRGPKGLFSEPADPWRSYKRPRCLSGRRSKGIRPPNLPPPLLLVLEVASALRYDSSGLLGYQGAGNDSSNALRRLLIAFQKGNWEVLATMLAITIIHHVDAVEGLL